MRLIRQAPLLLRQYHHRPPSRILEIPFNTDLTGNSQSVRKTIEELKRLVLDENVCSGAVTLKRVEKLARRAAIAPRLQKELIPAFLATPELTPLHSSFYQTYLKLLASRQDPHLAEFVRSQCVVDHIPIDSSTSLPAVPPHMLAVLPSIVVYGCLHCTSRTYIESNIVPLMETLVEHGARRNYANEFVTQCFHNGVQLSHLLPVLGVLLQNGCFPSKPETLRILSTYLKYNSRREASLAITQMVAGSSASTSAAFKPWSLFLVNQLAEYHDFAALCSLFEACDAHVPFVRSPTFWHNAITAFVETPISTILEYMKLHNITAAQTRDVQVLVMLRNNNHSSSSAPAIPLSSKRLYVRASCHQLRMSAEQSEDPVAAQAEFRRVSAECESKFGSSSSAFLTSLFLGWIQARRYSSIVETFESSSQPLLRSNDSWNLYLSALAQTGDVEKAWLAVKWCFAQNKFDFSLSDETMAAVIISFARHDASSLCDRLGMLNSHGYWLPVQSTSRLFYTLQTANVSYNVVRKVVFQLADPQVSETSPTTTASDLSSFFDTLDDGYVYSEPQQRPLGVIKIHDRRILDKRAIYSIVAAGFIKCPQKPWVAIQDLAKIKSNGIKIPDEIVRRAVQIQLHNVYGKAKVSGQIKRTREHVGRFFALNELLTHCNNAWGGGPNVIEF